MASTTERIPKPARELTDAESDLWNKIVKVLREKNLLQSTDFMMIDIICQTHRLRIEALQEIDFYKSQTGGSLLQVSEKTGYQQVHPIVYLLRDLTNDLTKQLGELGMSLSSITKITKEKKKTEKKVADPFEEFAKAHPDNEAA